MIVLDTHVWIWWVQGDKRLSDSQADMIRQNESDSIGICAISCWEVAKLVELGRLQLSIPIETWFLKALAYPGVQLLSLSPEIAIASTRLPGEFHRDPADQLIVASARHYNCPLLSSDSRISDYPHVTTIN